MAIQDLATDSGPPVFYEDGFRNMLEDHMTFLREHPETIVIEVTPMQAHRYEFDQAGLFNALNIPTQLHWIVMRMNRFTSPNQVPEDLMSLMVPGNQVISRLQSAYNTVRSSSL